MLIQLKNYQTKTLNELIKHNNSFVFWPRQTGKSKLLSAYIEHFVLYNSNQDILFICDIGKYVENSKRKLINDLPYLIEPTYKLSQFHKNEISFINSNYVTFFSFQSLTLERIFSLKPSLIIYDEFYIDDIFKFTELSYHMKDFNCKSIFTSTKIDTNVIKSLDWKNNYYINIIPVIENDNYNDYDYKRILNELSYKPDELLDFVDLSYQRKRKIKKLNKIADEG